MATLYRQGGNFELAGRAIDEAAKIRPNLAVVRYARLRLLAEQRKFDEVISELSREQSALGDWRGLALAGASQGVNDLLT